MSGSIRFVTWNVEWAPPRHVDAISRLLGDARPDLAVITEGRLNSLPQEGYVALGDADWGYPTEADRRKVLLWSRFPIHDPQTHDGQGLPPGRLVTAVCETPNGDWWVAAVCVPWKDAHVRSGRCDATPWQEHVTFLEALPRVLDAAPAGLPRVIAGDFNQRMPRYRVPDWVGNALSEATPGFTFVTSGQLPNLDRLSVQHIAVSDELVARSVGGLDRRVGGPVPLSDHDLIWADLTRADPAPADRIATDSNVEVQLV